MSADEVEVLDTAMENADRFYRVQWKGMDSSDADAQRACDAFKAVSEVGEVGEIGNQSCIKLSLVVGDLSLLNDNSPRFI